FCILHSYRPLCAEGNGNDGDGKSARLTGRLCHHGRGASACAAPKAAGDEDHVCSIHCRSDLIYILLSSLFTDGRQAARAQAASCTPADQETAIGIDMQKVLSIGVHRKELCPLHPASCHAVDGVRAPSTTTTYPHHRGEFPAHCLSLTSLP